MLELVLLSWLLLFLEAVDPIEAGTPLKDTGQWCVWGGGSPRGHSSASFPAQSLSAS